MGDMASRRVDPTGPEGARKILRAKKADLTEDDAAHMRKVVGYLHRHLAQKPSRRQRIALRYSLMNWGRPTSDARSLSDRPLNMRSRRSSARPPAPFEPSQVRACLVRRRLATSAGPQQNPRTGPPRSPDTSGAPSPAPAPGSRAWPPKCAAPPA